MNNIIEVNENIITGSIVYALTKAFGDTYKVYDEEIAEGFLKPSFHVYRITNINRKGYTGSSYKMENDSYRYVIKYFPSEQNTTMKDINDKINLLKQLFKYLNIINIVTVEGVTNIYSKPNRVNEINITTSEGVLLFEIQFDIRTVVYTEKDKVETNTLKVGSNI